MSQYFVWFNAFSPVKSLRCCGRGSAPPEVIAQLCAMGFDRPKVEQAAENPRKIYEIDRSLRYVCMYVYIYIYI